MLEIMLEPMTNNQVELMPKLNLLLINLKENIMLEIELFYFANQLATS